MVERTEAEAIANDAMAESWSTGDQVAGTTTVEPQQSTETSAQQPVAVEGFAVEKVDSYNAAAVKLEFKAEKDKTIILPPDTQIEAILVSGDDLIVREVDGDLILIKGGLKNIPTIVIGTVEIPAEELTASLEAAGITVPAAGEETTAGEKSSGGNFAGPPGYIGDPFDIRDLLKPTEFDRVFIERPKYEGFVEKDRGGSQSVPDDPPVAGSAISLALDDQNLDDGTTPLGPDTAADSITFTAGTNPISTIVFSTDLSGLQGVLDWVRVSDIQIVGNDPDTGLPVVTLDLSVVGTVATVTATLNDNYDSHPGIDVDDLQDLGSVGVVATDTAGLTATGTVNVSVSDDLPSVGEVDVNSSVDLDETDAGENFASGPIMVTSAAAIITAASAAYGADGAGTTVYTLELSADGVSSGLATAQGDFPITLSGTGTDTITGSYEDGGTQIAFTIVINGNGTLTVTQNVALEHEIDGDNTLGEHDDTLDLDGLISAVVTVTDSDGDTATGSEDIGSAITFYDDGPSIDEEEVGEPETVLVDETDLDTDASFDFSTLFAGAIDFGADGEGDVDYKFTLPVEGVGSGLYAIDAADTQDVVDDTDGIGQGDEILLYVNDAGTVITGSTALTEGTIAPGNTYFTITIDPATGMGEFDQLKAVWHADTGDDDDTSSLAAAAGSLLLTATVTDGDGDTVSHDLDLSSGVFQIDDDGLSIVAQATVTETIEEDDLNNAQSVGNNEDLSTDKHIATGLAGSLNALVNFGADGAGGFGLVSQTAAIAWIAGLGLVSKGEDVDAATVVGNTVTAETSGGRDIFTLTVNTDGSWTFTLIDQLDHHAVVDADDIEGFLSAPIDLSGLVVATDADGDTLVLADGSFTVDVQDDIPIDFSPADSEISNVAGTVTGDLDAIGKVGADEDFSIVFANVANGDPAMGSIGGAAASALTSSGLPIFLYNFGGVIVGTTEVIASPGDVDDIGDLNASSFVFTVTLDPDAGDDNYTFELLAPIDNGAGINFDGFEGISGGNSEYFVVDVPGSDLDLIATGGDPTVDSVNRNANEYGVTTGQAVNAGDILRFEFATIDEGNPFPNNPDTADLAARVTNMQDVTTFAFQTTSIDNNDTAQLKISAINADSLEVLDPGHATSLSEITKVIIKFIDGSTHEFTATETFDGRTVTFNLDGTVNITGLEYDGSGTPKIGDTVSIFTSSSFDRVEILNTSADDQDDGGSAFKVTSPATVNTFAGDPVVMTFDVELTDYDGDAVVADFDVTVTPPPPPPTVTVDIVDASMSDGNTSSLVTFEFSENVSGFDLADITPVGGTLGPLTTIDGDSYSATFTATDGFSGTGSVSVGTGYTSTATGITGTAGSGTVPIDRANPTATVNIAATSLNDATNSSLVTIQFSEAVTNFIISDLTAANGTLGSLTTVDADTYQVTFTAIDGFQGTGSVTLTGAYNDTAGNAGVTGASDTVAIDRTNPTAAGETIRVNDDTFVIPESILLLNDSNGAIDVANVSSPGGSNVSTVHTAGGAGTGSIAVEDLGGPASGGSFTYQAINAAGNTSTNATVTIVYDVSDAIDGTAGADIIIGGAGNDSLNGLAGADILYGGDGNDTLDLGSLDGVRDTVIFDTTAVGDTDTINQMLFGNLATSDVIDLSDLFTVDSAGGQTLSDYARVTGTSLQVDVDGGVDSFVTIATLTGFSDGVNTVSVLYDDNQTSTDQSGTIA